MGRTSGAEGCPRPPRPQVLALLQNVPLNVPGVLDVYYRINNQATSWPGARRMRAPGGRSQCAHASQAEHGALALEGCDERLATYLWQPACASRQEAEPHDAVFGWRS
jgi:hypothetical protein